MPGIYEVDRAVPMPDIGEELFNVDSQATPFISMVKQGSPLKDMLTSGEVEAIDNDAIEGIIDGADVEEFKSQLQEALEAYAMHQRLPWRVTKLTQLTSTAGIKDMKAHQAAMMLVRLKLLMERTALSGIELQAGSGVTPYQLRGVFKWLSATAQATKPVPEAFRPTTAQWHSAALSGLTAAAFETMLGAAADQVQGQISLDGFVGRRLKSHMGSWAQLVSVSSNESTLNRNIDVSEHKIDNIINVFDFEVGTVRNHLNFNILRDAATGAASSSSAYSGAFLNMDMWRKRYLQAPKSFDLTDGGGGPNGYCDVIWSLQCMNPKGQCAVEATS